MSGLIWAQTVCNGYQQMTLVAKSQSRRGFRKGELHILSYDLASGSEITPCIKIDKPLVVYRFFGKHYDVHNNAAYIMTKL